MSDLSINLGLLMVSMFVSIYLIVLLTLCDGEISVLRRDTTLHYTVSHCGSTTLLNQAPTPEGLGRCRVPAGGVLC